MKEEQTLKLEEELASIEREQLLLQAKAKSKREQQIDADGHWKKMNAESTANKNPTGPGVPVSKAEIEAKAIDLPAMKSYAAFLSHKKAHSKHGDSSETLAIRIKVFAGLMLFSTVHVLIIRIC